MGLSALVLRTDLAKNGRSGLVETTLSLRGSLSSLVARSALRRRRMAPLRMFMGKRPGCIQPLRPPADWWHDHSTRAPGRFAGQHGPERCDPGQLGRTAGAHTYRRDGGESLSL